MNNVYKSLEFDVLLDQLSQRAAFSLGKELILDLKPSFSTLEINRQLALVSEVMAMEMIMEHYEISSASDISHSLDKVSKDMFVTGLELLKVVDNNNSLKEIINKIKHTEIDTPNLSDIVSSIVLTDHLSEFITSKINSYGEMKDDATIQLKQLKKQLSTLNDQFNQTINDFIKRNQSILADTIISERNNRKVVLLNNNYKNSVKGIIHGESQSGLSVYFEPEALIKLNNEIQTVAFMIEEEITSILLSLAQAVKKEQYVLKANLDVLAELDKILALAKWGNAHDAITASISSDHEIILEAVAHPLIDPKVVVKNTYTIKHGQILIVSGPNTGGKTVTLKTIALSILMSMCGIPIIASSASIPIVDNIFVDLGDEQSVMASLSTFSSHLVRLADIVNHVTKDSLVLLDELGSGTDPKEGQALAVATLEHLRNTQAITLVTTHLSGLKTYAQHSDDILLASVEFDQEKLMPTYRFIEGLAGQSNALEIAQKYKFPKALIDRAMQLKDELLSDEEKTIKNLEEKEKEILIKQRHIEERMKQLEDREHDFEAKLKDDEALGSRIVEAAKKEAREYIQMKQVEADVLYDKLLDQHRELNLNKASEIIKTIDRTVTKETTKKRNNNTLKVSDQVRIDGMQHVGEVIELSGNNVVVNVNGMMMKTKLNKLEYVGAKTKVAKSKNIKVKNISKAKSEINLIGLTVYEAMPLLDKFIDNALVGKLSQVIVIHGMGTGVLRKAVLERLKKNSRVLDTKTAPQSSGGLGATLVNLK